MQRSTAGWVARGRRRQGLGARPPRRLRGLAVAPAAAAAPAGGVPAPFGAQLLAAGAPVGRFALHGRNAQREPADFFAAAAPHESRAQSQQSARDRHDFVQARAGPEGPQFGSRRRERRPVFPASGQAGADGRAGAKGALLARFPGLAHEPAGVEG